MDEAPLGAGAPLWLGVRASGASSEPGRAGDARPRGPPRRSSPAGMPRSAGRASREEPNKGRPSRARTSGRGGIVLTNDPNAARRTVDAPAATAINRMNVFLEPDVGLCETDRPALVAKAKAIVQDFNPRASFCQQARIILEHAVLALDCHEPRMALCKTS